MTNDTAKQREPLIGWMILEDYCDDMSDWSGVITYPDPTGANLSWENPTKMIEYSAFEQMKRESDDWKRQFEASKDGLLDTKDGCVDVPWLIEKHDTLRAENERLKAESEHRYKWAMAQQARAAEFSEANERLELTAESYRAILAKLLSTPEAYGTEGNETWDEAREALEKK